PLDYAFTDKLGRDITFEWHEDCESSNRGFQVDQVIARAGSEKVGFIKVDYVSSQKWKTYYPSGVLNFMSQIDGTSVLHHSEDFTRPATDLKAASPETLNAVAKRLVDHRYSYEKPSQPLENHRQFAAWFKANVTSSRLYKQSLARF